MEEEIEPVLIRCGVEEEEVEEECLFLRPVKDSKLYGAVTRMGGSQDFNVNVSFVLYREKRVWNLIFFNSFF